MALEVHWYRLFGFGLLVQKCDLPLTLKKVKLFYVYLF